MGSVLFLFVWFPEFVDNDIFKQLSTEWDCNLIRLPLYNGDTDWNDVYEYSEQIIKIIRKNNPYSLILVDGRDGDEEEVIVSDAEMAVIKKDDSKVYEGITTRLTPHGIKIYGIITHLLKNIAYRLIR